MKPELEQVIKKQPSKPVTPETPIGIGEEYLGALKDKPKVNVDGRILRLYLVPILAIVLFFLFNILVIIPKINNIISDLGLINDRNSTVSAKKANIKKLEAAVTTRSEKIISDLGVINSLAPGGQTQVVEYQNKISNLANQYNLQIVSQRTSDSFISETGKELKEIPTDFEMSGSLEDMRKFIDEISKLNDFVVVKSLALREVISESSENPDIDKNGVPDIVVSSEWSLGINLVKYQFVNATESLANTYLAIPIESTPPQSVQEYIDTRLGVIDNSLTFN